MSLFAVNCGVLVVELQFETTSKQPNRDDEVLRFPLKVRIVGEPFIPHTLLSFRCSLPAQQQASMPQPDSVRSRLPANPFTIEKRAQ